MPETIIFLATYFVLAVGSLPGFRIDRTGAAVIGPEQRDWGGYTGYFKDPDGFHWEVAHAPDGVGGITFP